MGQFALDYIITKHGRFNIALRQESKCVLFCYSCECELLLLFFFLMRIEKYITRLMATYYVPEDIFV